MIPELVDAWRRIDDAVAQTLGRIDASALRHALTTHPRLVITASGNSAYPARYLEWLLEVTGVAAARLMTPLAYALAPPVHPHCCLLVSQGARRRDSFAAMEVAARCGAPFFVLCGEPALQGRTVAAAVPAGHAFTTATLGEHAFLNLLGTGAAFAAAYELAAGLGADLPSWETVPGDLGQALEDDASLSNTVIALHGPAARCAAEALVGYHSESLALATACDMKNFTHGVWRGLGEASSADVYLLTERAAEPLARFLEARLSPFHDCHVVTARPEVSWSQEPYSLFLDATACWIRRAQAHARTHPAWSPLTVDKARWAPLLDLTRFDIVAMRPPEAPPPESPAGSE